MRAAVVGLGRIGFEFQLDQKRVQPASHVACYEKLLGRENVAVCDVDKAKLDQAKEHAANTYADINQMLKEFQPEIVSICTPTSSHAAIVQTVADYSCVKSIFLEKPIAQSLLDADKIINACNEAGISLSVDYTRRWSKTWQNAKDICYPEQILFLEGMHPGPVLRTGTHMIDLFNWFIAYHFTHGLEAYENITVQSLSYKLEDYMKDTSDYSINGIINYGDTQAILIGQQIPYLLFDLTIISRDKRVRVLNNGEELTVHEVYPSSRYDKIRELRHIYTHRHIDRESVLLTAITQTVAKSSSRCEGATARRALQIGLALHYSAGLNRPVKLKDVPYDYTVRSY